MIGFTNSLATSSFPRKRESRHAPEKQFYIYIMASQIYGVLYIGMTSNLGQRNWQHREEMLDGFTKKYHAKRLVYFEVHETAESAIRREKQLKKWNRKWKIELIEKANPHWSDLWNQIAA